ncbi:MAG: gluconokinase [Thermodesulfobacteriota bacterium]|nr:gluconokinase [Thermodesulfobacteriota bacterium]
MSSILKDLSNPTCLPDKTESVSVVQTHISFVFIADEFVYKVKKPVNLGFLDFSTLKKREYYCQQEIILNRRLSKDVYIDVLPITYEKGNYTMGRGQGRVVEYAVKMRRLPDEMLMKSVFLKGKLKDEHLKKVALILSNFHSTAEYSNEISKFGRPETFKINTDENFAQTRKYIGKTIEKSDFSALESWTENFYKSNGDLFLNRIKQKKIRDCHGDLHMEHIYLAEGIPIIDCIEFNDRFRYTDIVSDIAFLLMDLEYHGGYEFSKKLWRFYNESGLESGVDSLITFYKVYRAYVRGKVNSFQLDDDNINEEKKEDAIQTSQKYFKLARSYIE